MTEKDLSEYSIEELEDAIRSRNEMVELQEQEEAKVFDYNFGISDNDFASLVENTADIAWESVADAPWFVIYEDEERYVDGNSQSNLDEVKMLIDEITRGRCDTLYVLKKGKMVNFSVEIVVNIKG